MKNAFDGLISTCDTIMEIICELEDRPIEITQTEIQRKKVKMHESIQKLWDSTNQNALSKSQKKEEDRIDIWKDNGLGFSKNI